MKSSMISLLEKQNERKKMHKARQIYPLNNSRSLLQIYECFEKSCQSFTQEWLKPAALPRDVSSTPSHGSFKEIYSPARWEVRNLRDLTHRGNSSASQIGKYFYAEPHRRLNDACGGGKEAIQSGNYKLEKHNK